MKQYHNQTFYNLEGTMVTNWTEIIQTFDELNLREPLLRGIYGYGFERPSSIQQRVIKPCILGLFLNVSLKTGWFSMPFC